MGQIFQYLRNSTIKLSKCVQEMQHYISIVGIANSSKLFFQLKEQSIPRDRITKLQSLPTGSEFLSEQQIIIWLLGIVRHL